MPPPQAGDGQLGHPPNVRPHDLSRESPPRAPVDGDIPPQYAGSISASDDRCVAPCGQRRGVRSMTGRSGCRCGGPTTGSLITVLRDPAGAVVLVRVQRGRGLRPGRRRRCSALRRLGSRRLGSRRLGSRRLGEPAPDGIGVGVVELLEDGQRLPPRRARGVGALGGVVAVAQPHQHLGDNHPVRQLVPEIQRPLVGHRRRFKITQLMLDVADAVPGEGLPIAVAEFGDRGQRELTVGQGRPVLAQAALVPAQGVERLGLARSVSGGPEGSRDSSACRIASPISSVVSKTRARLRWPCATPIRSPRLRQRAMACW